MLGFAQLRAFEAVTRTGSFTKAAERLRVTIPAVSLQIRQLEREHGVTLFERLGRRVRLTPAGEMLRQYADRIFTLAHDAERALESTGDFRGTRLRLAATPTAAGYYLAPFCSSRCRCTIRVLSGSGCSRWRTISACSAAALRTAR